MQNGVIKWGRVQGLGAAQRIETHGTRGQAFTCMGAGVRHLGGTKHQQVPCYSIGFAHTRHTQVPLTLMCFSTSRWSAAARRLSLLKPSWRHGESKTCTGLQALGCMAPNGMCSAYANHPPDQPSL